MNHTHVSAMKSEIRGSGAPLSLQSHILFNTPSNPLSGALRNCLGSIDGACIEKLLFHCASALEINDVTFAQQVMWVLNNVASSVGDPNQRLTSWFLKALIFRASKAVNLNSVSRLQRRLMSVTEFAGYVDLIPWHRFGYCASNSSIFKAIQGHSSVHILDFSITHCMQWPTLIDALAKRPDVPPSVRITVPSSRPLVPPLLDVTIQEVGLRLANFAKFRDVPFEFNLIDASSSSTFEFDTLLRNLNPLALNLKDEETLIVNCQNWLRYLPQDPEDCSSHEPSIRDRFLDKINALRPHFITLVDEDADLSSTSLTSRITACFNYIWIPFDALETFLPKDSMQRMDYEADVGDKIENIIGSEGPQRIERLESGIKLTQRMKNAGFSSVPFCEETMGEVKFLLDEHASGWGMKREEDMLVLTWKGHNSVFATAWIPNDMM